jgi:large subunit ribosomal protein L1
MAHGVEEAKAGRVDFRIDRSNLIHVILGKVSFTPEQLRDNLRAMVTEIERNRPSGAKGELIRGVSITSTMGPGINLDLQALKAAAATSS